VDDAVLDELYAAPLDEFIERRTSLAKQLKADGRGEEAAEVAGLRKPAVPLWAVNQLARRNRPAVEALLEAGQELRHAIGKGDREAFGAAQARQADALRRLRDAAASLLGKATAPTLDRVAYVPLSLRRRGSAAAARDGSIDRGAGARRLRRPRGADVLGSSAGPASTEAGGRRTSEGTSSACRSEEAPS